MINLTEENVVSFADAARLLPKRSGKRVHVATVYRWAQRGINGVRLEVIQVGGTRCTSTEALQRFFAALGEPGAEPVTTARADRRKAIEAAERELLGMLNEGGGAI